MHCLFLSSNQIAEILDLPGQHIVIEALLPVDVVNGFLDAFLFFLQRFLLGFQNDLPFRNCPLSLQAEGKIRFHFCDAQVAVFQAVKAVDPGDVFVIKDTAVLAVPLYIGDKSLVAIELQCFIGKSVFSQACFIVYIKNPPEIENLLLTGSYYRYL